MKKVFRYAALVLTLALVAGLFTSCLSFITRRKDGSGVVETQVVLPDSETKTESETEEHATCALDPAATASESETESESEPESEPASEPESEPASEPESGQEALILPTAEELEAFLSTPGVNGFLISVYSDVRDASLREVIYQLSDDAIPYEDVVAVLEKKYGELMTSVTYISAEGLQALVLERTGRSLDEFRCDLSDCYMNEEDLDLYYVMHGDTNMQPVKVLEVAEESGKIVVRYTTSFEGSDWFWINSDGEYGSAPEMEVVLVPGADGYRFVSNNPAA
ncbi:MAG: hypothetical protein J5849_07405 [Clostridia bacterium]|nr:hypothetical protein [Clostridia bacterium]